ncbi:hypothetical protein [Chitinophaga varians]|uniref:hypothetical protein n=1 Tax=Chitinophaga varians TaxID=2202339 RepID=UPI00165ED291|nr:hypothetical protein [Chitinophaga varians]MBC9915008.1 hypothetical protein [Chitinophaga varians]
MNRVEELTNLGGFPMTQYTLDFMQKSYRESLGALARLVGSAVIVSGMEDNGNTVANGWISYNGELLPFIGGAKQSTWIVEELKEPRKFADLVDRNVYFTRQARFAAGGIAYSSLQRIDTLLGLKGTIASLETRLGQRIDNVWKRGDVIEVDCSKAYLQANFDSSGLGINERTGWAICNGANGTRNRGGRFAVGYDPTQLDYNDLGKLGGKDWVSLTADQNGPHSHNYTAVRYDNETWGDGAEENKYGPGWLLSQGRLGNNSTTSVSGYGSPHENRPPFFVTLWIMKL